MKFFKRKKDYRFTLEFPKSIFGDKQSKTALLCVNAYSKKEAISFIKTLTTQEICNPVYKKISKGDVELVSKYVEIRKNNKNNE